MLKSTSLIKRLEWLFAGFTVAILLFGGALAVEFIAQSELVSTKQNNSVAFCDFVKYYICGKLALSQDRHSIYDRNVQQRYLTLYSGPSAPERSYIDYPPYDFPMMVPIALFPIEIALGVWWSLSFVLFWLGVFLLGLNTNWSGKSAWLIAVGLSVLLSMPGIRALILGQSTFILFGLICLFCFFYLKEKEIPAGIVLGLTTFKPQYLPFLVLPALATMRFKLLGAFFLTELLILSITVLTVGFESLAAFPSFLWQIDQSEHLGQVELMTNLRAIAYNFLPKLYALLITGTAMLIGLFILFSVWLKSRNEFKQDIQHLLSVTVVASLALSPHTHMYDCLVLGVAALMSLPGLSLAQLLQITPLTRRLFCLILVVYPALSWLVFSLPATGLQKDSFLALVNMLLLLLGITSFKGVERRGN